MDEIFGIALLVATVVWIALDVKRALREDRQRDWDSHVTTTPGMADLEKAGPATDWDAWADELKGWA